VYDLNSDSKKMNFQNEPTAKDNELKFLIKKISEVTFPY
jgi:hypothetical protein